MLEQFGQRAIDGIGQHFNIWGVWIRDANCPFKLIRRETLSKIMEQIPQDSFIPMVLVSVLAHKMQVRIREVPITHLPRKGGSQSLKGLLNWVAIAEICLQDIVKVRRSWNQR